MSKYSYTGTGVAPHPCAICGETTRFPKVCLWCWRKYREWEIDKILEEKKEEKKNESDQV